MSRVLEDWAYSRGVELDFTRPGKPTDNSYIESFNGKLRDECLNVTQFSDSVHAQQVIAACRIYYSEDHPHGTLA
jgi:putative transposase